MKVIEAFDGELYTSEVNVPVPEGEYIRTDIRNDILKIVVKDRYNDAPPSVGFIKGFGLKRGAFASSIAHDSHNIVAIGTNDRDISEAVNEIIRLTGGLAVAENGRCVSLQLNIGGIMTSLSCEDVSREYSKLNELVGSFGCTMKAPFMTLSFMALLVIPELKIGDKGLFDVGKFEPVPLFIDSTDRTNTPS
jgi:adenine deaminase